jgi:hypothetical protein
VASSGNRLEVFVPEAAVVLRVDNGASSREAIEDAEAVSRGDIQVGQQVTVRGSLGAEPSQVVAELVILKGRGVPPPVPAEVRPRLP